MEPKEVTLTDGATPRRVVAKSRGSANHYNDGGLSTRPTRVLARYSSPKLLKRLNNETFNFEHCMHNGPEFYIQGGHRGSKVRK